MGLLAENLVWLLERAAPEILAVPGAKTPKSMIELGNQFAYIWEAPFKGYPNEYVARNEPPWPVAKGMFERLGFKHTSVDINGQDGAIALDLSLPQVLPPGVEQADIVTDFGTSEHVPDLYECQRNIWNFCKVGGLIFQVNPEPGSWPGHGRHYRALGFYTSFALAVDAEIVSLKRDFACGNKKDGWNTWCCYRKKASAFMERSVFEKLTVYAS
jgi:hypothetical protein